MPDRPTVEPLTFAALDGLVFAAVRRRLDGNAHVYAVADLGPLVEMLQLARTSILPPISAEWLRLDGLHELASAAAQQTPLWIARTGTEGHCKCSQDAIGWSSFGVAAHKAALAAGFPAGIVRRLIGAVGEIRDNVLEHSEAPDTGSVMFRSRPGSFEFAVADAGIGVLASMKSNSEYRHLRDEGDALWCALSDGESRFGKAAGRGTGFSQLFKSLAALNASLRFRSGDHALTVSGRNPTLISAHVAKKPPAPGFLCSVDCRAVD